jgi:hypothetical protein
LEEIEFIKNKIFSIMDALSFLMVKIKGNPLIKAECGMIYSDMRIAVDHLLYIRSNIRIETSIEGFHKEIVELQDVLEDMSALETKSPTYKEAKHSKLSCQYFANQLKRHIKEILTVFYDNNKTKHTSLSGEEYAFKRLKHNNNIFDTSIIDLINED